MIAAHQKLLTEQNGALLDHSLVMDVSKALLDSIKRQLDNSKLLADNEQSFRGLLRVSKENIKKLGPISRPTGGD